MENDKVVINILGCCVSRDILEQNKDKYLIPRYAAFVSPWSMFTGEKVVISDEELGKYNISNFRIRCLQHDANLSTLDYLKEQKSDWLLLDLADTRLSIADWHKTNVYMSYTTGLKGAIKAFENKLGNDYNLISCADLPWDEFETKLIFLFDKLLELYKPEQIIFNEIYCADSFIGKKGEYRKWDFEYKWMNEHVRIMNPLFKKVYNICLKKFIGCHKILWPNSVIADETHRWGIYPLHYHNLYYEYAEKCIGIITQKLARSEEESAIENLRQLYSEKFATLRAKAELRSMALDRDKWRSYAATFKSLINSGMTDYDETAQKNIVQAFKVKGCKHISVYGDTEITKVLVHILKNTDISIEYIVENAQYRYL